MCQNTLRLLHLSGREKRKYLEQLAYLRTYGVPLTPASSSSDLAGMNTRPQSGRATSRPASASTGIATNPILDRFALKNAKSWKAYLATEGKRRGDFDLAYPADECAQQPTYGRQPHYDHLIALLEIEKENEHKHSLQASHGHSSPVPVQRHFRGLHAQSLAASRHLLDSFSSSTSREAALLSSNDDDVEVEGDEIIIVDDDDLDINDDEDFPDDELLSAISHVAIGPKNSGTGFPAQPPTKIPRSIASPRNSRKNSNGDIGPEPPSSGNHISTGNQISGLASHQSSSPLNQWMKEQQGGAYSGLSAAIFSSAAPADLFSSNGPSGSNGTQPAGLTSASNSNTRPRPASAGRIRGSTSAASAMGASSANEVLLNSTIKVQPAYTSNEQPKFSSTGTSRPSSAKQMNKETAASRPLIGLSALLSMSKSSSGSNGNGNGNGNSNGNGSSFQVSSNTPSPAQSPTPPPIAGTSNLGRASPTVPSMKVPTTANAGPGPIKIFAPIPVTLAAAAMPVTNHSAPLIHLLSNMNSATPPMSSANRKSAPRQRQTPNAPAVYDAPNYYYDVSEFPAAQPAATLKNSKGSSPTNKNSSATSSVVSNSTSMQNANKAKYSDALDPNKHIMAWESEVQARAGRARQNQTASAGAGSGSGDGRQRRNSMGDRSTQSRASTVTPPIVAPVDSSLHIHIPNNEKMESNISFPSVPPTSFGIRRSSSEPINAAPEKRRGHRLRDRRDSFEDRVFPEYNDYGLDNTNTDNADDWSYSQSSGPSPE
jgi:hypothetical protein